MEHRWSQRKSIYCDVLLIYPKEGRQVHTSAQNISLGGIFVQTGPEIPLVDSFVELSFTLPASENVLHNRILGQVVHASPNGAGIMFCDLGDQTVRTLRALLYAD